ncbi:MAG: phosphoribosylamine--glycine ligase [Thermoleophilaceae bacterium]|nr:phosphoribosylamine--glycine ligase [Thermoleophilaceae bacterium]
MRILVVGSGGREHAIVRALIRTWSGDSPLEVICAPGNPGIERDARCVPGVSGEDVPALVALAQEEAVDLVAVGPEVPLVDGLVDELAAVGIKAFGPERAAAQLEGSKIFCKEVLVASGVPTAGYEVLRSKDQALEAVARANYPAVFKSDGLAAGKGVIICADAAEAAAAIDEYFTEQRFGETDVILEEFLEGVEVSLLAICDGERAYSLVPARDYKRIFDNDEGPNTGGMGAFSPVPDLPHERLDEISAQVHQPIIDEMKRRGADFHGILYAGLMLTDDGVKVLEYNTRFGDPETQALLPRLQSDLAALMLASVEPGGLAGMPIEFSEQRSVTLTLASAGYPEGSSKGDVIRGLDDVSAAVEVTHAGTARNGDGQIVTAGGRVINVTALSDSVPRAREAAYAGAALIDFDGKQQRMDIAAGIEL